MHLYFQYIKEEVTKYTNFKAMRTNQSNENLKLTGESTSSSELKRSDCKSPMSELAYTG